MASGSKFGAPSLVVGSGSSEGCPFLGSTPGTDSVHSWGAHLGDFLALGIWNLEEQGLHINHLGLLVVFLTLQSFQQVLSGSVVLVMSNKLTVGAYLRKSGGTRSKPLSALAWMVFQWCKTCSISLPGLCSRKPQCDCRCAQSGVCQVRVDPPS